jgi:ATP-dependent Clp protease ATP-binding subunit ClpC
VLVQAAEEANKGEAPGIGTEHFLLALIDEEEGIAAGILESRGVLNEARSQTLALVAREAS